MPFRITGLSPEPFRPLYGLPDDRLAVHKARRYVADLKPGYPDRIELRDAEPGESLLLVSFTHQPADNPYRASHAVFVLEGAETTYDRIDEIPEVLRLRQLSLRAFGEDHFLVGADLVAGRDLEGGIDRMFADAKVAYIQAHYAKPGCFAARIDRA